jgi:hypothetical protein
MRTFCRVRPSGRLIGPLLLLGRATLCLYVGRAAAKRDERQRWLGGSLGIVGREQLPREHDGALTFGELIGVLDQLAGERVVCVPDEIEASGGGLEVAGRLRRLDGARGHLFAVGDSAWLALDEADFRSANLRTIDGNDFFVVKVELGANTVVLGDDGLLGSDRSDPGSSWNDR